MRTVRLRGPVGRARHSLGAFRPSSLVPWLFSFIDWRVGARRRVFSIWVGIVGKLFRVVVKNFGAQVFPCQAVGQQRNLRLSTFFLYLPHSTAQQSIVIAQDILLGAMMV
jgi:hypothetical protein